MKKFFILIALLAQHACTSHNEDVPGLPINRESVILGDSIFALTGDIKRELALITRENYRGYARSGARMLSGRVMTIPEQFAYARQQDPIRRVLLNGGGNDIIYTALKSCRPYRSDCEPFIEEIVLRMEGLFAEMSMAGVQEILYLEYFYPVGPMAGLEKAIDLAMTRISELCQQQSSAHCQTIPMRMTFINHPEYIMKDGIHPTRYGARVIAEHIAAKLELDQ